MPEDRPRVRVVPSGGRGTASRASARHELPAVDEAGLAAARHVDRVVGAARERGSDRWVAYFDPLADRFRDDEPRALRQAAMRARAAFGPKDSIRDVVPGELTEPLLDSIDRLLKQLNRRDVAG